MIRAYNDWQMEEWCGVYPGRLIPLALSGFILGPEWMAGEIRRMADKGCHATSFHSDTHRFGQPDHHGDEWDPAWQACQDTDTVMVFHFGSSPEYMPRSPFDTMIHTMPFNTGVFAAELLWSPVLRKFPRAKFALAEDDLVCILPGRLNFQKGHDLAVDAVRSLRRSRPELRVVCLFAGAGDLAGEIEAYALHDDADAAAFRFLGFLNARGLREAYWAADIGLLPSRAESFGLVIPEAMRCGCVPVRTPSGGWQDQIVDGVNGFVVPFDDAPALAERIATLADRERRETMRGRAIAHATENFDQRRMLAATADLYREVAG